MHMPNLFLQAEFTRQTLSCLCHIVMLFIGFVFCVTKRLCFRCSMEGGELFSRIQERGDQAFTERGFSSFSDE